MATTSVDSYKPRAIRSSIKRANRPVERRDQLDGALLGLELRRGAVMVPGHAVDRDERDPLLDQPTCQERTLAEGMAAIAVANQRRLGGDIERARRPPCR